MAKDNEKNEMTRSSHPTKIELTFDLLDLDQITVSAWKKAKGKRKEFNLSEGCKILLFSGAKHVNVPLGDEGSFLRYQMNVNRAQMLESAPVKLVVYSISSIYK